MVEKRYQQLNEIGAGGTDLPSPASASRRAPVPARRRARLLLIFLIALGGLSVILLYGHVRGWSYPSVEKENVSHATHHAPLTYTTTVTVTQTVNAPAPTTNPIGAGVNAGGGGGSESTTAAPAPASPAPTSQPLSLVELGKVSTKVSERNGLFLQAVLGLNNDPQSWTTPSDWKDWLIPQNRAEQSTALERLVKEGRDTQADLDLYRSSPIDWWRQHTAQGVVVFSKSYCPYSRKAKALLTDLGAKFTVIEVDLRPDATELQAALSEVTGHKTFPNILIGSDQIGGSDDLAALHQSKQLEPVLKSFGAL